MPLTAGEWSPKVVTTTERFCFTESLGNLACGVESSNAVLQKVHLCGLMGTYKCFVLIIYPFLQPSSTIRFKLFWDSYCIRCLSAGDRAQGLLSTYEVVNSTFVPRLLWNQKFRLHNSLVTGPDPHLD